MQRIYRFTAVVGQVGFEPTMDMIGIQLPVPESVYLAPLTLIEWHTIPGMPAVVVENIH